MVWSCELRVVGCKTGCSQLYPVRLDCWSEVREHFTPLACFAGSARGQNRLMDRYSWPTNYWVNIKYPNMIFSFTGWLCPKSAELRTTFFTPPQAPCSYFRHIFAHSFGWPHAITTVLLLLWLDFSIKLNLTNKLSIAGLGDGAILHTKNWQKRESWISAISTTSWKPDLTTSSKPGQCYVFWCSGGRGPSSCSTH